MARSGIFELAFTLDPLLIKLDLIVNVIDEKGNEGELKGKRRKKNVPNASVV